MKKNIFSLLGLGTVVLTVLMVANSVSAQGARRARGKVYTKAEVGAVIKRVETRVDHFVDQYDRALDKSSLNGTDREDWLNKRAKDLERATDELRREFDRRDSWHENKNEVWKCLNIATDIDKNMKNKRFPVGTEDNWRAVVYELNTLAKLYNIPSVGSSKYK